MERIAAPPAYSKMSMEDFGGSEEKLGHTSSKPPFPPGSPHLSPASLAGLSRCFVPLSAPMIIPLLLWFTAAPPPISLQGGVYALQLHAAVRPHCAHSVPAVRYNTTIRTAFASFPRSGNSYMRSLLERGTGYQTSSTCEQLWLWDLDGKLTHTADCDKTLPSFLGECDRKSNFFVKVRQSFGGGSGHMLTRTGHDRHTTRRCRKRCGQISKTTFSDTVKQCI